MTTQTEAYASNMLDDTKAQPSLLQRITINPNQCGVRPCIRRMRIRVKDVLDMLADGASEQQILQDSLISKPRTFAPASPMLRVISTIPCSSTGEHAVPG